MKARKEALDFLKELGMATANFNLSEICNSIISEMEKGLAGAESSLEMIPTYVDVPRQIPLNTPVAVFDAGGTNFRTAIVHFDSKGDFIIDTFKQTAMPAVDRQLTKDEFFAAIAEIVQETASQATRIGFCFSYPSEITPERDGRLIRFTKEIKAPQVIGELIGANLLAKLKMKKPIVILNDTVATLLAGKAASHKRTFSSYIGFILGTGSNASYVETAKKIVKRPGLRGHQIINIELGNFNKLKRGLVDEEFDATTTTPGFHVFEKMISGAYLGPLTLCCLKKASQAGLFSKETAERIELLPRLETKDLSQFLANPMQDTILRDAARLASDLEKVYAIGSEIVDRAAKLAAAALAACVLKSGKGKLQTEPVCITAEGSTFYKMKDLKVNILFYLKQFLQLKKKRAIEIIAVHDATLMGAAIAAFS